MFWLFGAYELDKVKEHNFDSQLLFDEILGIQWKIKSLNKILDDWGLDEEAVNKGKQIGLGIERIEIIEQRIRDIEASLALLKLHLLPIVNSSNFGEVLRVNSQGLWQKYYLSIGKE